MKPITLIITVLSFFIGCSNQQETQPTVINVSDSSIGVNPEIQGSWKSIGSGYILDANSDRISLYSYTNTYCYKETNDYLEGLMNSSSRFSLNQSADTLKLFFHDFGEKTAHLQKSKDFVRLDAFPENCVVLTEQQEQDPEFLFDLFMETLEENYAFSEERNLDWGQLRSEYDSRVTSSTSIEELFGLIGEIVEQTKDHHTKIIAPDGRTLQYSVTPSAEVLSETYDEQDQYDNIDEYFDAFFETIYTNISDSLLHGEGQKVAGETIEWGELTPEIGYINVHALSGFASSEFPRIQHIDTLNFYMQDIMQSLHDKEAIIVDVSLNFGGYDAASLTIASYFAAETTPVYTHHTYVDGAFYQGLTLAIQPSINSNFTKPVYLLTSDISRSAAETFAMQMRALPNVTHMGISTLGILSDMLGKTIGEFYLTISNEKYVAPDGSVYEVSGVTPDEYLDVFPREDMFNGHMNAVREIVALINAN